MQTSNTPGDCSSTNWDLIQAAEEELQELLAQRPIVGQEQVMCRPTYQINVKLKLIENCIFAVFVLALLQIPMDRMITGFEFAFAKCDVFEGVMDDLQLPLKAYN
jgi:hypothetical protein